jgi:DNA-binding transcriptional ArsR family regulator
MRETGVRDPSPSTLDALLHETGVPGILNHMVQYSSALDDAFAAVADSTRRGIIERLGTAGPASITELADAFDMTLTGMITELADAFDMTLTGMKKHVQVLEDAGLIESEKVGRVRTCRLGSRRLAKEAAWIARYERMLNDRYDRLEELLGRTSGD